MPCFGTKEQRYNIVWGGDVKRKALLFWRGAVKGKAISFGNAKEKPYRLGRAVKGKEK